MRLARIYTNTSWDIAEFKEIRKEWKARKKEEDNQRKAEEERQRGANGGSSIDGQSNDSAQPPPGQNYAPGARPHLPPIGYAPAGGQVPAQYPGGVEQMYQQGNGQVYTGYPHSPYGQGQQMYPQRCTPIKGKQELTLTFLQILITLPPTHHRSAHHSQVSFSSYSAYDIPEKQIKVGVEETVMMVAVCSQIMELVA